VRRGGHDRRGAWAHRGGHGCRGARARRDELVDSPRRATWVVHHDPRVAHRRGPRSPGGGDGRRAHRDRRSRGGGALARHGRFDRGSRPRAHGPTRRSPGSKLTWIVRFPRCGRCGVRRRRGVRAAMNATHRYRRDPSQPKDVVHLRSSNGARRTNRVRDHALTPRWRDVPHRRRDGGRGSKKALFDSTWYGVTRSGCWRLSSV